jgi:pyrroloquinoline quinone biosynthesis protein B
MPSCAALTHDLMSAIDGVDVLLLDGTLFTDHELVEQGLSEKAGAAMGHISMSGPKGAIESLRRVPFNGASSFRTRPFATIAASAHS